MAKKAAPLSTALAAGIAAAIAAAGIAADAPPAYAAGAALTSHQAARSLYIVLFDEAPLATYAGGVAGIAAPPRTGTAGRAPKLDAQAPQSQAYVAHLAQNQRDFLTAASATFGRSLQAEFTYAYAVNGLAVALSAEEAARIAQMPGVVSVQKNELRRLNTDSGPAWIGAPSVWQGTSTGGAAGTQGEGMVIGDIDTGINFASPSFAATGGDGYQHVNPRGAGTYLGTCATGGIDAGKCNDKLIGAYELIGSLLPAGAPDVPGSAADHDEHGSHTASTAAGNHTTATTPEGATAPVSGVAPHASVIMYKACFAPPANWTGGTCYTTATTAAADRAVADGVDAINFSIGGGADPWTDTTSIAFRNAAAAGIFVATAAGNTPDGSTATPGTADHLEPWTLTVGASTHDRLYSDAHVEVPGLGTLIGVKGGGGVNGPELTGPVSGTLAVGADRAACTSFAPAPSTPNFIAVIERGGCNFAVKVNNAKAAGAAAVVIYNNTSAAPIPMGVPGTTIPALMLTQADGQALATYITGHAGATGTADLTHPPTFNHSAGYGDIMGNFSLLGPAGGTATPMDLIKPEITAPGVSILAAGSSGPNAYVFLQGTSMATPHVTGSGTLLRKLHPDWTPMEIKSALMLTAKGGVRKTNATDASDPFDSGSGRVDLTRAAASPLVMNETVANMLAANPSQGGDLSALNEPSLSKAACGGTCTFTRTFRNPTSTAQSFTASVQPTNGGSLAGTVTPATFTVAPGATQTLTIKIDVGTSATGTWSFGQVGLTPASGPALALPVAVRKSDTTATGPVIAVTPTTLQSDQAPGETKTKTLTVANSGDAALTWTIGEQPASVTLSLDGAAPQPNADEVNLQVDLGLGTNALGVGAGTPIIFLNRFTPAAADLPFTLDRVDLEFVGHLSNGGSGAAVGEKFDVYVYQDNDSDPSNGATLLGSVKNVAVSVTDALQSVTIPSGIPVSAAGDVLIAVVARDATGGYPATGDAGPSVHRSWIGTAFSATIGDPPDLAALQVKKVEEVLATFSRNFVLRGHGTKGSSGGACTALADVPWLSAAPTSGTTAPGANSNVTVTFDSTGMAAGSYSANICVNSNDTAHAVTAVPVTMTVSGGGTDVIFKDGFEGSGGATCQPAQLFQDPSFEATTAPFGSNPSWQSTDSHDSTSSVFCNGDCINGGGESGARTGNWWGWFGGWAAAGSGTAAYTAFASQSVTIPSGSPRFLNFWKRADRASSDTTADTLSVTVDGTEVHHEAVTTVEPDYVHQSVDLGTYADGASHTVKFTFAHAGTTGDGSYFLDDVTLDCSATSSIAPTRPAGRGPSAGASKRVH
jgi:subtilisin family serine protease